MTFVKTWFKSCCVQGFHISFSILFLGKCKTGSDIKIIKLITLLLHCVMDDCVHKVNTTTNIIGVVSLSLDFLVAYFLRISPYPRFSFPITTAHNNMSTRRYKRRTRRVWEHLTYSKYTCTNFLHKYQFQ